MGTENDDLNSGGIDMDAAAQSLANDLGFNDENPADGSATPNPAEGKDDESQVASPDPKEEVETKVETPTPRAAPKSWPKETHAYWGKLEAPVQDLVERREKDFLDGLEQYKGDANFAKNIRETLAPYQALMTAQNISDPAVAVKGLLNAHYQLSMTDEVTRTGFMANLLKQYKIDPAKLAEAYGNEPAFEDPALKALRGEVDNLKNSMTSEQTRKAEALRVQVNNEVATFANDPAHPYFNEVADDIMLLLQDPKNDLKLAYEKAVRANPVTWAKEEARMREAIQADIRKKDKEAALKARKAQGTDIRGRESERSPTDPLGTMEDTLRETYATIQNRQ